MKFIKFSVIIFLLLFPFTVYAAENQQLLDLTVDPQKVLFDLRNLKPGDVMERVLVVGNNVKERFNYKTTSKLIEGSEKFYDSLYLKVSNYEETLYEGRLSNFKGLEPRLLEKGSKEELLFSVKVPSELGNDYQGLYSKVQFKFYVEGTLGGILPADGPTLPNTATNMFNIFASGLALLLAGLFLQMFSKYRRKITKQL
jgi:LPXTG-motif cell wall-anchored protein